MVYLNVIFLSTRRIKSFFPCKDSPTHSQRSRIICINYAKCWDCIDTYIEKKSENFKIGQLNILIKALAKQEHEASI